MSDEQKLLNSLIAQIKNDKLVLPTLPEIAIRVRDAVDDPDSSLNSISEEIAKDPAMTARMIRVANTAAYAGVSKVTNLSAAVNRIGLSAIKNIATSMAMEQLFLCQNDLVFDYFDRAWQESVEVASAAVTLLQLAQQNGKFTDLEVDTMTLMGLVHNIGVLPILAEAEKHEAVFANKRFLDQVIDKLQRIVGSAIVKAWSFDEPFVVVVERWNDQSFGSSSLAYLDFVRLGAVHAGVLRSETPREDLLQTYLDKGVIGDLDIFEQPAFVEPYEQLKSSFE